MRNAALDELQDGLKIDSRNINNLRYVDDTTLMAEREEELKSLFMRVKEESERAGLRLNNKKKKLNSLLMRVKEDSEKASLKQIKKKKQTN